MKKLKAFLLGSLLIVLCLCFLAGCSMPYGAELYSHAQEYISQEFKDNYHVRGAYYRNENYDGYDDGYYDKTSPKYRTFIITEEAEFKEIFTKYNGTVDFENKLVILYTFADSSPRECFINEIYIEDVILTVKYKYEQYNEAIIDAVRRYQRFFMLIMDKTEFSEVEFIETR